MDFSWPTEDQQVYDHTQAFSSKVLKPLIAEERLKGFPRQAWKECAEHGIMGIHGPTEFGGQGRGPLFTARLMEALSCGAGDNGFCFSVAAHMFACVTPITRFGGDGLKHELLPGMLTGEKAAANAITEAGAGSDVYSMKMTAREENDYFVLDGIKTYVTNATFADLFITYGVTNPEHGFFGITAFAVDRETPGLTVGEPFKKIGLQTSPTAPVYYEECRVPKNRVIGEVGQGGIVFEHSMQWERACLFAIYVGQMQAVLDKCIGYAQQRVQFGKPIGKFQSVANRIVDMKVALQSCRHLLYHACWLMEEGKDCNLEISISKLEISEAAVRFAEHAVSVFGGMGVVEETGIGEMLGDAMSSTVFSGTSDMQRRIIARELGL
jgi:alkylation response protein AidB-like acyl-CoA dehydrogenase